MTPWAWALKKGRPAAQLSQGPRLAPLGAPATRWSSLGVVPPVLPWGRDSGHSWPPSCSDVPSVTHWGRAVVKPGAPGLALVLLRAGLDGP